MFSLWIVLGFVLKDDSDFGEGKGGAAGVGCGGVHSETAVWDGGWC